MTRRPDLGGWLYTEMVTYLSADLPIHVLTRPGRIVESHSGARETIIAGPYHNLIPYAPRPRRGRRRREEGNVRRVSPHHPTGVSGSVVSSPSRVQGEAPDEIGFYASEVRYKPSGIPFLPCDAMHCTHSLTAARNRLWVVAPSMLTGHQQEPMRQQQ